MKPVNLVFILIIFFILGCAPGKIQASNNMNTENQVRNVDMLKNGNISGIETKEIDYGGAIGFLAQPKKEGKYPAVVMIHEWWGLNDNIKEMTKQLASEGYVVLAVDLFNGKIAKDSNEARELITPINKNPDEAVKNMKAAVQYLRNQNKVDKTKISSMGWCFGGGMSLQLALNEQMAATVIYYGNLVTDKEKLKSIKWPVLGIFGEKDTSIPAESARNFDKALDEFGIKNEIYIYPNVGHAFANPSGMNYAPEETKNAWKKTVDFLKKNLKS